MLTHALCKPIVEHLQPPLTKSLKFNCDCFFSTWYLFFLKAFQCVSTTINAHVLSKLHNVFKYLLFLNFVVVVS